MCFAIYRTSCTSFDDYVDFFVVSSLYHLYNSAKLLFSGFSANNLGFIIAQSHKYTYESLLDILPCFESICVVRYVLFYDLRKLYGIRGLLKKKLISDRILEELRSVNINKLFTANDREFVAQMILENVSAKKIYHMEDGLDAYVISAKKESWYKYILKKLLFSKYKNLPYLGLHPKIQAVWVNNKKLVPNGKFSKEVREIPKELPFPFIKCVSKVLGFESFVPKREYIVVWIISNSEIISDISTYLNVYKAVLKELAGAEVLVRFHPREESEYLKQQALNLVKSLGFEYKVLPDKIGLEFFVDFLLKKGMKPIFLGDQSTAIFQFKIMDKGYVISKLKDVLEIFILDSDDKEQLLDLYDRIF